MKHFFAEWRSGLLVLLVAGVMSCKPSSAAQTPANTPVRGTARYVDVIPPDPGIQAIDVERRNLLLNSIHKSPLPLFEPNRLRESQRQALKAFSDTFSDRFLPKELLAKVKLSSPECGEFGCSIDVMYPASDWATFVAVNEALLVRKPDRPPSPFMSFPGNRYRTGRVQLNGKTVASWILTFRVREPEERPGSKEET